MAEIKINWYPARKCWRKSITVDGKETVKYYQHSNNARGKEAAIAAYLRDKAALTGMTFDEKVRLYLPMVLEWLQKFPQPWGMIVFHLRKMLETLELPDERFLSEQSPVAGVYRYPYPLHLFAVNWGLQSWELPEMFQTLLRSQLSKKTVTKNDGSIGYYLEQYKKAAQQRSDLKNSSISARVRHIIPYEKFIDTSRKITGINNESIREFHKHLNDNKNLSEDTRNSYWSAYVQFLKFLEIEADFERPKQLTLATQRFITEPTGDIRADKQEMLWTPALFQKTLKALPEDKQLWILLCLNCGMRNTDISHLRWIKVKGDRLLHQRVKLNKHKSAPTINYKLWPETQQLLEKQKRKSELVFLNRDGEPYHKTILIKGVVSEYDGIANWWQKNKINYDLKRLDFLRKTGSSFVARNKLSLVRMYLAETNSSVEATSYVYNDGLINRELDVLTDQLHDWMFSGS